MDEKWICCRECGTKMIKVRKDTVLIKFPAYCKRCKKENIINYRALEPVVD